MLKGGVSYRRVIEQLATAAALGNLSVEVEHVPVDINTIFDDYGILIPCGSAILCRAVRDADCFIMGMAPDSSLRFIGGKLIAGTLVPDVSMPVTDIEEFFETLIVALAAIQRRHQIEAPSPDVGQISRR